MAENFLMEIKGEEIEASREDVKNAFEKTEHTIEHFEMKHTPFHFLEIKGERKPVKEVFRNLPAVDEDFEFDTGYAETFFEGLDSNIYNKRKRSPELFIHCLEEILQDYEDAKRDDFSSDHRMYKLLSDKATNLAKHILRKDGNLEEVNDLIFRGSAGQGNWTNIPWIAILDPEETETTQEGVYVIYLFEPQKERAALTMMQGVTELENRKGKRAAKEKLREKAEEIRELIDMPDFEADELKLDTTGVGELYGPGTIFYKEYNLEDMPEPKEVEMILTIG